MLGSVNPTVFRSPELSEMQQGIVYASVPTFDDCVQINNQRIPNGKQLLRIVKDELGVSVGRVDEAPLQAEINHREEPFENEFFVSRLVQKRVLTEPLALVTFVPTNSSTEDHSWLVIEDPENQHPDRLSRFSKIIGSVALEKQRKAKTQAMGFPAFVIHPTKPIHTYNHINAQ